MVRKRRSQRRIPIKTSRCSPTGIHLVREGKRWAAQGGKSQKRSQSTLVTAVLWCSSPYHETVRRASPLGTGGEGGDKGRE